MILRTRPVPVWLVRAAPPDGATASRFLPWAGFVAMRTDWSCDATYLCFDVGPLGMDHIHQDKLSFTLWKGDEELIFDDGGGQYEISSERDYAVSGYDHSTLLVDGLAQFRREPKRATEPINAAFETSAVRDRAVGVYDQGFGPHEFRLATHRREIVFDKTADVFTVTDEVRSADGRTHDYTLLFQLDTTNVTVTAGGGSVYADYGLGRKWALGMSFAGADSVTSISARLEPSLAGWFVGRNDNSVRPATTVFVRSLGRVNHTFVTKLKVIRAELKKKGRKP